MSRFHHKNNRSKHRRFKPRGREGKHSGKDWQQRIIKALNYFFMALGIILGLLYLFGYR